MGKSCGIEECHATCSINRDLEGGVVFEGKPGGLRIGIRPGLRCVCRDIISLAIDMGCGWKNGIAEERRES